MRLDKWAVTAQEALQASIGIATDASAGQLMPIHLLKALLSSGEHNLRAIIERVGADPTGIEAQVDQAIARQPRVTGDASQMGMGDALVRVTNAAEKLASKMGDSYVTTEHLLCALADAKDEAGSILKAAGVTSRRVEEAYSDLRGDERVTSQDSKPEFEALTKYGRNVTDLARQGKLDPIIGRVEEIRRTIQVLSRRTKNNPVLAAPSRCSAAAPRTTPCSSASRAWARPPSWRASRSASSTATCRPPCVTRSSSSSTCPRSWRAPSTAASSRTA